MPTLPADFPKQNKVLIKIISRSLYLKGKCMAQQVLVACVFDREYWALQLSDKKVATVWWSTQFAAGALSFLFSLSNVCFYLFMFYCYFFSFFFFFEKIYENVWIRKNLRNARQQQMSDFQNIFSLYLKFGHLQANCELIPIRMYSFDAAVCPTSVTY